MPVTMSYLSSGAEHSLCSNHCSNPSASCVERQSRRLAIGVINNMPDGALEATEQQYIALLKAASNEFTVCLSFYSLPEIVRSASTQKHIDQYYKSMESLLQSELDGLIVTGKEPITANLSDEPFWQSFVEVLEWACEKTCSTIWSCLAAHAAVLHMDGIQRVRNCEKHSGIFKCEKIAQHPVTANLPDQFQIPHSRWNGLLESDLTRAGYQVLSRTYGAGVDCFVKQNQSLFLFFQGHPEYHPDTLLMEYRRDVLRYLRGESHTYPNVPEGYFDQPVLRELLEVQHEAVIRPHAETLARLETLLFSQSVKGIWHATAETIYSNWLQYVSLEKKARMLNRKTGVNVPPVVLQPALSHAALVSIEQESMLAR